MDVAAIDDKKTGLRGDAQPLQAATPSLAALAAAALAASALAACGGGGSSDGGTGTGTGGGTAPPPAPPTEAEASRFLAQASMGASRAQIARVQAIGYSAWLDEQIAMPASTTRWDALVAGGFDDPGNKNSEAGFDAVTWQKLLASPDTLRQRFTLALSEIFVTAIDGLIGSGWKAFAAANYLDVLEANAFGNHRTLLQQISTNTAMGMFLTFRASMKANPVSGSLPDENYARELMQLFTIGLVELEIDGTPKLVGGAPDLYLRAGRRHRPRSRLHRLGFRYPGPDRRRGERDAGLPAPADGAGRIALRDRRQDLPRHDDPGRHRRRHRADDGARHHLRASQRGAVRGPAADPAPRHQQPEPGLRVARRGSVSRRRQRRQGQPQGGDQGDPARRRSAQRRASPRAPRPASCASRCCASAGWARAWNVASASNAWASATPPTRRRGSARARCDRRRCSISSVPATCRRTAPSPARSWSRRSSRSPTNRRSSARSTTCSGRSPAASATCSPTTRRCCRWPTMRRRSSPRSTWCSRPTS